MHRVLFVDHVNRILGGAEINLVELLSGRDASAAWESHCAVSPGSHLEEALQKQQISTCVYEAADTFNKVRVVGRGLALAQAWKARKSMSGAVESLEKVVQQVRPDVIISCTNKDHYAVSLLNERRPKANRIPAVWWVNDVLSSAFFSLPFRAGFAWRAIRFADRLVAVSDYAKRVLVRHRIPASRIVTIHNGIPLENYAPRKGAGRWRPVSVPIDEPLVAIIGRFTPWKGQQFFLELAAKWLKTNSSGYFALIGKAFNEDAAFEQQLRDMADHSPLKGRVHFIPFQSDLREVLSGVDVLVHASVRPEPFGRVIIEAMAAGVPVLAAKAGGVPEIITHGKDGLLARPGDVSDYTAQLGLLLGDPALRSKLAEAARETAAARFSIDRVRSQFGQLIKEVACG